MSEKCKKMLHVISTLHKILKKKQKTESSQYIDGYRDCLELLKIGFGKTNFVNPLWENHHLKLILYELLNYEFEITDNQIQKIKNLFYLYANEDVIIEKLYTDLNFRKSGNTSTYDEEEIEVKLQNLLLKEAFFKLVNHRFTFPATFSEKLFAIAQSRRSESEKVRKMTYNIAKTKFSEQPTKAYTLQLKNQELQQQIESLLKEKDDLLKLSNKMLGEIDYLREQGDKLKLENTKINTLLQKEIHLHSKTKTNKNSLLQENQKIPVLNQHIESLNHRIYLLHTIIDEKNDLLRTTKQNSENQHVPQQVLHRKVPEDISKRSAQLMLENLDLFVKKEINKYDRNELHDILSSTKPLSQKMLLINLYLKRSPKSKIPGDFRLTEKEQLDIRKILISEKNFENSIQELFNYITFILAANERKNSRLYKKLIKK